MIVSSGVLCLQFRRCHHDAVRYCNLLQK